MSDEKKERYKLQEAAEIMAQGEITGTSELLLRKLKQSVRDGDLKVFPSGSNILYEPDMNDESRATRESDLLRSDICVLGGGLTWVDKLYDERVRELLYQLPNDLEAYWDDLNNWIDENEPRIVSIFQKPDNFAGPARTELAMKTESCMPWEIKDYRDPEPEYPWYTPARYFARQLVKEDSTLLTKRHILAKKIVQSLTNIGIKKRGGIKPFDPGTIKKALSNVILG